MNLYFFDLFLFSSTSHFYFFFFIYFFNFIGFKVHMSYSWEAANNSTYCRLSIQKPTFSTISNCESV